MKSFLTSFTLFAFLLSSRLLAQGCRSAVSRIGD
jgi:hypothetical protein